jgi:hypothetical protein
MCCRNDAPPHNTQDYCCIGSASDCLKNFLAAFLETHLAFDNDWGGRWGWVRDSKGLFNWNREDQHASDQASSVNSTLLRHGQSRTDLAEPRKDANTFSLPHTSRLFLDCGSALRICHERFAGHRKREKYKTFQHIHHFKELYTRKFMFFFPVISLTF